MFYTGKLSYPVSGDYMGPLTFAEIIRYNIRKNCGEKAVRARSTPSLWAVS